MDHSNNILNGIEIGLGAWQWGEKNVWGYGEHYHEKDIEEAFSISLERGVKLVDTAEIYGNGRSEKILGKLLNNQNTHPIIASKLFPYPWRFTQKSVIRAFEGSLERIGLPRIDLYQIHWPNPIVPMETQLSGLAQMVTAGKLGAIGVSNFNQCQMFRAVRILLKYNIPLAANQVEYNLLNRTIEKNGLLQRCTEMGIRIIAYSPIAMGLLSGKYNQENPPTGLRGIKYANQIVKIQPLIRLLTEIGHDHEGKTAAQVAINWCICKGTLPIPGAKNFNQAASNAESAGWRLSEQEVASLDAESDRL